MLTENTSSVVQMRRLVEVLGVPPTPMLEQSPPASRDQFFEVRGLSAFDLYKCQ